MAFERIGAAMRLAFLLVMFGVVLVACDSGGAPEVQEPETVETCDGLVDVGTQLVRAWVQVLDETELSTVQDGVRDENMTELDRVGGELDSRVAGLGCDATTLNTDIVAATADVEPESAAAVLFLDVVRQGLIDTGADQATTTSTEVP